MRKILFAAALFCLAINICTAQDRKKETANEATDTLKPYQKNPTLPAFNIRMMDSVTIFNTYNIPEGKPVALMLFSPECKHCNRTMKALTRSMDSIKNIQFYLVTGFHDMAAIRAFYKEHHLADYPNIKVVGRDYEFFYMSFFKTRIVPDIALYDSHKKLVKLIEGETTASEIHQYIH